MPRKEADVLKVSPFPTSATFIQWRQDVQRRLVAASALSDEAEVAWVAKAWQNEIEMADLGTSEEEDLSHWTSSLALLSLTVFAVLTRLRYWRKRFTVMKHVLYVMGNVFEAVRSII